MLEHRDGCLSVREVAGYLRVSPKTIYRLLKHGELQGIKLRDSRSARWRIRKEDLEDFLTRQTRR